MAKKKKTTSNVTVTNAPVNIIGNVNVKKLDKNGKVKEIINVKNTATFNLLQGLGYHLLGNTQLGRDTYPKYLGIGYNPSTAIATTPIMTSLTNELNVNRFNLNSSDINLNPDMFSMSILFTTLITFDSLVNQSQGFNELGLFSTFNSDSLLARVYWDHNESINLKVGESVLIEWEIILKSITSEVNN